MASWKHDPLYREVFREVQALWQSLEGPGRPLLFRVEERASSDWGGPPSSGRLRNIWIFDGHGARLAPILRHESHDFGPTTGEFSRYGLVQFAASRVGDDLTLNFTLGPAIVGEIHYGVERDGEVVRLLAHSGTPCL